MRSDAEVDAALRAVLAGSTARDCESETLDFKTVGRSASDTLKNLAEAAACFANHRGLTVDVRPHEVDGVRLLVVSVPESAAVHSVGGQFRKRLTTSCQPMSADQIARLVAERRGEDWTDSPTELDLSAVDPLAMTTARQFLREATDPTRRDFAQLSEADLLRALGVVTTNGKLNRAGALLFVGGEPGRELLREAGSINARMVRLVLDTDTPTTSRILADLVERGLLVKTSNASRGPGVTYGPGPSLPAGVRRPHAGEEAGRRPPSLRRRAWPALTPGGSRSALPGTCTVSPEWHAITCHKGVQIGASRFISV